MAELMAIMVQERQKSSIFIARKILWGLCSCSIPSQHVDGKPLVILVHAMLLRHKVAMQHHLGHADMCSPEHNSGKPCQ